MAQPDLTTLQRVKDYLRSPVGENAEVVLQDMIRVASRMIRRETRRRFTSPVEVGVSRTLNVYGNSFVYVDELRSPADLISVSGEDGLSVLYKTDFEETDGDPKGCTIELADDATAFATAGLSGRRLPADHGDLFIRELGGYPYWGGLPDSITVTGNFGWPEIPEDIAFAAVRTVALWFKEEIAHYTDDAFISRGRQFNPEALPPITMAMLRGGDWIVEETF